MESMFSLVRPHTKGESIVLAYVGNLQSSDACRANSGKVGFISHTTRSLWAGPPMSPLKSPSAGQNAPTPSWKPENSVAGYTFDFIPSAYSRGWGG